MMKVIRIIFTVIFTLILVVSAFAAEAAILVRGALLNPAFYSKTMVSAGFYTPIYDLMSESIRATVLNADLPENLDDRLADLIREVMPRKEFNKTMGEFVGGAMNYLFYRGEDIEVPFAELAEKMKENIADSLVLAQNGLVGFGDTLSDQMTGYIDKFIPSPDSNMLSDYIEFYFANGDSGLAKRLTDMIYTQFVSFETPLRYLFIASTVLTVLMLGLLYLVWLKKPGVPTSVIGVLLDVSGGLHLLCAAVLFVTFKMLSADFVYSLMPSILPASIVPSVGSLAGIVSLLIAIIGLIMLALGVALNFAAKAMNKPQDKAVDKLEAMI